MEQKFEFDEKEHIYTLNGKPLLGTTTVLGIIAKPALIPWAAGEVVKYIQENCEKDEDFVEGETLYTVSEDDLKKAKSAHRKKKEKAADWGTLVHKAIEIWIATGIIPEKVDLSEKSYELKEEHFVAITHFVNWAAENSVRFIFSEKRVYSTEWWLGGTIDFICEINGKKFIGDIKTSSNIYEEYFLQTAAYAKMALEMGIVAEIDGMIILNCKKDGEFKKDERYNIHANIKAFEAALTLYKRLKLD